MNLLKINPPWKIFEKSPNAIDKNELVLLNNLNKKFGFPVLGLGHTPDYEGMIPNIALINPIEFKNSFPYPINFFNVSMNLVTGKLGLNSGHGMSMYVNEKWLKDHKNLGDLADLGLLKFSFLPKMKSDLIDTIGNIKFTLDTYQNG